MVTLYFDTPAIVKRYHKEIGSDTLDKIFELRLRHIVLDDTRVHSRLLLYGQEKRAIKRSLQRHDLPLFLKEAISRFALESSSKIDRLE